MIMGKVSDGVAFMAQEGAGEWWEKGGGLIVMGRWWDR